jgi:ATP-dependent helicase/nuclease subunit A
VKQPSGDGVCGLDLFKRLEENEDAAERLRLLYVATTRAADYLIVSSGVGSINEPSGDWRQLLAEQFDLASGALRASLPDGYPRPVIRVTKEEPAIQTRPTPSQGRPRLGEIVARVRETPPKKQALPASVLALPADRRARRGFSFSRLSGELKAWEATEAWSPEADEPLPVRVDALGLGTLVHEVLAVCDFREPANIRPLVARHAERVGLESSPLVDEAVRMIERFAGSPRAAELADAREVHRELEFLLAWPPGASPPESRYLHGFIDCLYADPLGRWHLVDYKTNRVTAANVASAASPYEMQMLLYAWAAERAMGTPPVSLVLHFLAPGVEHSWAWDDAARQRTVALIERAMAAAVGD